MASFGIEEPATDAGIREAADALRLSAPAYRRALELATIASRRATWILGVDRFLLAFGVMAVLAGVAAFFAYNWGGLHHFAKFALIEFAIVAGVATAAWRGIDSAAGRGGLMAAAFLVGILFAVYGQFYQTGADPYGLFLAWGLLVAGWVLIGRQAGLWMLLLVLANLALILFWTQVLRPGDFNGLAGFLGPLFALAGAVTDGGLATAVLLLNAIALVTWEGIAAQGVAWMQCRWWPRVTATFALAVVVTGTLFYILGLEFGQRDPWFIVSGPLCFALFASMSLWYYQYRRFDLFMLTVTLTGGIVCATAVISRLVFRSAGVDTMLLIAIAVIAQTAGAAFWLRRLAASEVET